MSDNDRVLDTAMLEQLAIIAAAHQRTLVDELNLAVESYVDKQHAEFGEMVLVERALAEQERVASRYPSLF